MREGINTIGRASREGTRVARAGSDQEAILQKSRRLNEQGDQGRELGDAYMESSVRHLLWFGDSRGSNGASRGISLAMEHPTLSMANNLTHAGNEMLGDKQLKDKAAVVFRGASGVYAKLWEELGDDIERKNEVLPDYLELARTQRDAGDQEGADITAHSVSDILAVFGPNLTAGDIILDNDNKEPRQVMYPDDQLAGSLPEPKTEGQEGG